MASGWLAQWVVGQQSAFAQGLAQSKHAALVIVIFWPPASSPAEVWCGRPILPSYPQLACSPHSAGSFMAHLKIQCPWEALLAVSLSSSPNIALCLSKWYLCQYWVLPCSILFLFLIYLFYLFSFGCVGSSLLHVGFFQLRQARATLCCSALTSHCRGFSCCRAQAGSRHAGFSSCGSRAVERRLSSCGARALLLHGM